MSGVTDVSWLSLIETIKRKEKGAAIIEAQMKKCLHSKAKTGVQQISTTCTTHFEVLLTKNNK